MHLRTSLTTLAVAALLPAAASATAATEPLSAPHITNHFKLTASQQPENITVDRTGAAYLTFSFARQIVRVSPGHRPHVLATLPAPAKASTPNLGRAFVGGIARADDGTLYVTYATGTADLTGVWAVHPGGRPHRIAALPADGLPNGLALDQHVKKLYVTDSVRGVIYRLPTRGGKATVWAKGTPLEPTTLAGANGLKLHNGSVWATNLDRGTMLRIPVTARAPQGPSRSGPPACRPSTTSPSPAMATRSSPPATATRSTSSVRAAPTPPSSLRPTAFRPHVRRGPRRQGIHPQRRLHDRQGSQSAHRPPRPLTRSGGPAPPVSRRDPLSIPCALRVQGRTHVNRKRVTRVMQEERPTTGVTRRTSRSPAKPDHTAHRPRT